MRDHKAEYARLSPEAKAKKIARNKLPKVVESKAKWSIERKSIRKERFENNFFQVIAFLEERDNHEGCIGCGTYERLELDHINRQDKEFDPRPRMECKTMTERQWKEIEKCQLLCYDCHREKTGDRFRK